MKPQLIGIGPGRHNEDIEGAFHRIVQGATWKKARVIAIIPAGRDIPTKVHISHCSLIFPPNQPSFRMAAIGEEVGKAYSDTIEWIVSHPELREWEYILTYEHDNIPPPDGLIKLIERMDAHPEFSCVGGLYWTKGPDGVPQIWGDPKDPILNFRPQPPHVGELVECCGTGMGFNLWRISMFRDPALRRPWFKTQMDRGVSTQDLYFWADARKHGYRCAVDCAVLVGHYDKETDIVW